MISINLVPAEIKEKIVQARKTANAFSIALVIVIFMIVVCALVKAADLMVLQPSLQLTKDQVTSANASLKKFTKYQNAALVINDRADLINKIDQKRPRWAEIVPVIASFTPTDMQFDSLAIDAAKSPNFSIQGTAKTQNSVIAFKDSLTKSNYFKNVLLKNSSISSVSDINNQTAVQKVVFSFEFDTKYLGPIPATKGAQ